MYARLDATVRSQVSRRDFTRYIGATDPAAGRPTALTVHAITPYRTPELLLAVDFSGPTTKGGHVCGFVLWSGAGGPSMGIRRIESNALPPGLAGAGNKRQLAALLTQLHCPPALVGELTSGR